MRVFLVSGLLAGMVFNLGGFISAWVNDLPETFERFGVIPSVSMGFLHLGLRFLVGFASIYLYKGMRERKPGSSTAMKVGILIWIVGYIPSSFILFELGVLSLFQLEIGLLLGLVESVTATMLGCLVIERELSKRS